MAALTSACARLGDRMDAEMLVKAHWAFARLRHRPPPGDMNRIVGAAKRLVGELPDEDRLTVMHAWGVLRINPGDDIVSAFTESFRAGDVVLLSFGAHANLADAEGSAGRRLDRNGRERAADSNKSPG